MSTLAEIEMVVEQLPLSEQEELLRHLQARVRRGRSTPQSRESWMRRLDGLRASLANGVSIQASEPILEELRED